MVETKDCARRFSTYLVKSVSAPEHDRQERFGCGVNEQCSTNIRLNDQKHVDIRSDASWRCQTEKATGD